MAELIINVQNTKATLKRREYKEFAKLIVIVLGIYWCCTYIFIFLIGVSESQYILKLSHSLYIFFIELFNLKSKINIEDILYWLLDNVLHLIIIIFTLLFFKIFKKTFCFKIQIQNLGSELPNSLLSIIGSFIITIFYYYRFFYFSFKNFDIFLFIAIIPFIIIPVVTQEIIFRGIIQTDAMNRFGKWQGIIISSGIFALNHLFTSFDSSNFIIFLCVSFIYGVLWGYFYSKNKNLLSPIIGHALTNILVEMI